VSSATTNLLLFGANVACWAGVLLLRPDPAVPNLEAMPEMVRTARYGAFSPNENFADGATLRPPVSGTIARGAMPLHYAPTPEDAVRAGLELESPLPPTGGAALARGAQVYAAFCQACHGAAGLGDGPIVRRGFPAPPSLLAERAVAMRDGQLFHVITYGQGNMPPYAAQVSAEDRWNVVALLRSWQRKAAPAAGGAR
jgi:mono/diheme cytochrome c family protein